MSDETKEMIEMFTWNITQVTQDSIDIQLAFEYPELIGTELSAQKLLVYAEFSDFEPKWNDLAPLIDQKLPR